ncbi:YbjN domain-containing protein [Hyphomonas sp.]|jgi:hypothetical protein|uniref:YbjN domain-containing protein n=1 Tax=Hyphomonas sp. TaxID=87 RepID=UPI003918C6E4
MSLTIDRSMEFEADPLDSVEAVLEALGWPCDRDDEGTLQVVAETRWGDMGALFAYRPEPSAIHFSLTLDVKAMAARRAAIAELVMLANERLWIGHFDFWAEDGVIIYRYTFPMEGREEVTQGEVRAVLAAAVSAADRFMPAFNFLVWAGKSPREAMDAVMFETQGEA